MQAHVIENGVVVNTIEVESLTFMPNLVEATEGGIGWLYDDGVFTNPNAPTQEELNTRQAESVRRERNRKIAETDWMTIKAADTGVAMASAWATYRQALRDITSHANFPNLQDADWPTKP
tara:strand:+ start:237 stop:596 length:360 start_codon:yes stop_codon:yes gene_type:complete